MNERLGRDSLCPRKRGDVDNESEWLFDAVESNATAVREAFIGLGALWDVVVEATTGYRERLLEAGFSSAAAEDMTVDFHRTLIDKFNS